MFLLIFIYQYVANVQSELNWKKEGKCSDTCDLEININHSQQNWYDSIQSPMEISIKQK